MGEKLLFPIVPDIENLSMDHGNRTITHVGIHHSASSWGDAETINDWHRQSGKFSEFKGDGKFIGYNFVINNGTRYPKGFLQIGRPLERTPAAHKPKNTNSIAICIVGNFSQEVVDFRSDPRFQTLAFLCNRISSELNINFEKFYGHRELTVPVGATECPGTKVELAPLRQFMTNIFMSARNQNKDYFDNVFKWDSTKDRILCLQYVLNRYFGYNLATDGILGPKTLLAWQEETGMDTTKVKKEAWWAIIRAISKSGTVRIG